MLAGLGARRETVPGEGPAWGELEGSGTLRRQEEGHTQDSQTEAGLVRPSRPQRAADIPEGREQQMQEAEHTREVNRAWGTQQGLLPPNPVLGA